MLAEALAHGCPKLHVLDLRFNKLKDAGAQALAKGFAGVAEAILAPKHNQGPHGQARLCVTVYGRGHRGGATCVHSVRPLASIHCDAGSALALFTV